MERRWWQTFSGQPLSPAGPRGVCKGVWEVSPRGPAGLCTVVHADRSLLLPNSGKWNLKTPNHLDVCTQHRPKWADVDS